MHKALLVLGLLQGGPKTGYDLHRIVRAHGELYTDLKKANLYYLLERLAAEGYLEMEAKPGGRGPRRERLVYALTPRGRERFGELLRADSVDTARSTRESRSPWCSSPGSPPPRRSPCWSNGVSWWRRIVLRSRPTWETSRLTAPCSNWRPIIFFPRSTRSSPGSIAP